MDVDGVRLRFSVRGEGCPVLLLTGIGGFLELWEPFERALDGRGIQTISFDAPGTGGSTGWRWPRRMPALAGTTDRLLDALGYPRVDVLGASFGGALAQQLAHQVPGRVRRLVLAATMPGLGGMPGDPRALLRLMTPRVYRSDRIRGNARLFGGQFRRDPHALKQAYHGIALPPPPTLTGYLHQLYAVSGWSSLPWLHRILQPTLVLAGDDDPIVPLLNGRILAWLIPRARLHVFEGGGHLFLAEQADEAAALVATFLSRPASAVRAPSG